MFSSLPPSLFLGRDRVISEDLYEIIFLPCFGIQHTLLTSLLDANVPLPDS